MIFQAQTNLFTFPSGTGNTKIVLFNKKKKVLPLGQVQLPLSTSKLYIRLVFLEKD